MTCPVHKQTTLYLLTLTKCSQLRALLRTKTISVKTFTVIYVWASAFRWFHWQQQSGGCPLIIADQGLLMLPVWRRFSWALLMTNSVASPISKSWA